MANRPPLHLFQKDTCEAASAVQGVILFSIHLATANFIGVLEQQTLWR